MEVQVRGSGRYADLKFFLITTLLFLGAGATQSYVAPYVRSFGYSALAGTAVLAAIYVTQIPARFLTTYLENAIGLKASLLFGVIGYVVYPLVFVVSKAYWQFVAVMAFWGLTSGVFWTAAGVAALNEAGRENYGRVSGALFAGSGVGMAAGVLLLDYIIANAGTRSMFLLSAIPPALALGIAMSLSRGGKPGGVGRSSFTAAQRALTRALRNREAMTIAALQFMSAFTYGIVYGGLGLLIGRNMGIEYIGRLTVSFYVLKGIFSRLSGSIGDRIGRRESFILSFACSLLASVMLATSKSNILLVLAGALLGYQVSTVSVNANGWVGDAVAKEDRSGFLGAMQAWNALGVCVSLFAGGYLLNSVEGSRLLFWAFAGVSCLAILLSLTLRERRGSEAPAQSASPSLARR